MFGASELQSNLTRPTSVITITWNWTSRPRSKP